MATPEKNERESASGTTRNTERGSMTSQAGATAAKVGQRARRAADDIGEHVEEGLEGFREKFDDVRNTVVDSTKRYARATDDYVNDNPWLAVGIGAGIGLLLGMMMSSRGDRPYS